VPGHDRGPNISPIKTPRSTLADPRPMLPCGSSRSRKTRRHCRRWQSHSTPQVTQHPTFAHLSRSYPNECPPYRTQDGSALPSKLALTLRTTTGPGPHQQAAASSWSYYPFLALFCPRRLNCASATQRNSVRLTLAVAKPCPYRNRLAPSSSQSRLPSEKTPLIDELRMKTLSDHAGRNVVFLSPTLVRQNHRGYRIWGAYRRG